MRAEHRVDLAELDAVAADLDLAVDAAAVVEGAVRQLHREIAGAVQGRTRDIGERVRLERFGAALGIVQIALGELDAADPQLAERARRHHAQLLVEHAQVDVRHRAADRDARRLRTRHLADRVRGHVDRGLGRPVQIGQADAMAVARHPAPHERDRQRLAAEDQLAQLREFRGLATGALLDRVEEFAEQRGHEVHHLHAAAGDPLQQRRRIAQGRGRDRADGAAVLQRPQQFPDRDVEADRGLLRDALAGLEPEQVLVPVEAVRVAAVREHHTLRRAGRAGGVEHHHRVIGASDDRQISVAAGEPGAAAVRLVAARTAGHGLVEIDQMLQRQGRGQALRELGLHGLFGQQRSDARVAEHVRQAGGRVIGIERHIGAAGLEDGEQRDHEARPAMQHHADQAAARHAACAQELGELVRLPVQLGVAELALVGQHGERLGRQTRLLDELQVRQRGLRDAGLRRRRGGEHLEHFLEAAAVQQRFAADAGLEVFEPRDDANPLQ